MKMAASEERQQADDASVVSGAKRALYTTLAFDVWFWLSLMLGAALRLWAIDVAPFLGDQSSIILIAREAVVRHALPIASIPSSINTLNPPLSIYLLMPFVLLSANPLPAMISVALWNVLGIALCYVFASYFFERRIAVIATLFFAVSPAAIWYSRFLWQQNYLPPLLILWAIVLYAGCIRGRRGMLAPAVALLVMAGLLHATALLLAPALIVGVLIAPQLPRLRDYIYSTAIVLLLLVPTILWEVVSKWSDLHILMSYSAGRAKVDPQVFFRLYQALGGPGLAQTGATPLPVPHSPGEIASLLFVAPVRHPAFGAASPYSAAIPLYITLALLALFLFVIGWLALTRRIILPALRLRSETPTGATYRARWAAWLIAIWHGLRSDASWRAYLLLWLTVTSPLVAMLRHSSGIFTHYLIPLYPFAFLTMAIGVLALARGMALLIARVRLQHPSMPLVSRILVLALVAFLVAGQTAQTALSTYSVASGQFDAATVPYGYPLSALTHADAVIAELQRREGASEIYIAETSQFPGPVDYMLVREHANRVGYADTCLILPPPRPSSTLVVVPAGSPSARALAGLTFAAHVADIPMAGNSPLTVYRFTGSVPALLPGETQPGAVRFADRAGQGLQLDGVQLDMDAQLRVHWTVLSTTPGSAAPLSLRAQTRPVTPAGQAEPVQGFRDCEPTRWEAGATVLTWLPAPPSWQRAGHTPGEAMLIQVQESTARLATPSFGPLPLLAAQTQRTPWFVITPEPLNLPGNGRAAYDGVELTKALLTR